MFDPVTQIMVGPIDPVTVLVGRRRLENLEDFGR